MTGHDMQHTIQRVYRNNLPDAYGVWPANRTCKWEGGRLVSVPPLAMFETEAEAKAFVAGRAGAMTTTAARIRFRHLLNNVWDVEIFQADLKHIEEAELANAIETLTGSRLRALSFGRNRPVRVFTHEKWAAPKGWVCAGDLLHVNF